MSLTAAEHLHMNGTSQAVKSSIKRKKQMVELGRGKEMTELKVSQSGKRKSQRQGKG